MSSSNGFACSEHANLRPIELHRSALADDEYDYYIKTFLELLSQSSDSTPHEQPERPEASLDISLESKVVTLREARAWLRGRFQSVPSAMVDEIIHLLPSPLTGDKKLTGGQFFAVLRLMLHAQDGMRELDKNLTFRPVPMTFMISSGTADLAKDAADKIPATSPVEASQNDDDFGSTRIQGPLKKWNEKSESSTTIPASPSSNKAPAAKLKATARSKSCSKKVVPAKRAIDIESEEDEDEDDDDVDENTEKKRRKDADSAPQTGHLKSQSNGPPAKARRTNAGKRKSDATVEETAAKAKGSTRSQKPTKVSVPVAANKSTVATPRPLAQRSIKKAQYSASMPMSGDTRVIKAPSFPWSHEKNSGRHEEDEEDGEEEAEEPPLQAKSKSNFKSKPQSKSDEHESDDDPKKTKSDSSSGSGSDSDSDSENENKNENGKKQKASIAPSPAVARRTAKTIVVSKTAGSKSVAVPKGPKGSRISSDGFLRPPPNKSGQYTISDITGSRTSPTGAVELCVSWQGYPESESSWEPLDSIKDTGAYARWAAMWARLKKKGLRDVQLAGNKRMVMINGRKQEQRRVQEVGTHVNKATWIPTKEANEMMAKIERAILEDERGNWKMKLGQKNWTV